MSEKKSNFEMRDENFLRSYRNVSELVLKLTDLIKSEFGLPFDLKNYTGFILNTLWNKPLVVMEFDKEVRNIWLKK